MSLYRSFLFLLFCFYVAFSSICTSDIISSSEPVRDSETIFSHGKRFKLGFFSHGNSANPYGNTHNIRRWQSCNLDWTEGYNLVIQYLKLMKHSTAQLVDTGYLILKDSSSGRILWESFQYPIDLTVHENGSPDDPSVGSFSAGVQLQYIPHSFIWNNTAPYWRTSPWNKQIYIGLPEMKSSYHSGDENKKDWVVAWANPRSECDFYAKCGLLGSCNPRNEREWEKGDWSGGCIRRTALDCERNRTDVEKGKQDGFLKLQTLGSDCLSNCSCTSYSYYTGIGCTHWNKSLTDIQEYSMDGAADLFIRLAYSELAANGKEDIPVAAIAITVPIGSVTVTVCGYLFWKLLAKHRERKRKDEALLIGMIKDDINKVKIEDITFYCFDMLANATNKFHSASKLGQGGFGPVYKGKLSVGQEIVVKRLSRSSGQGLQEFMNEVVVISRLQHRNLFRLLGCCTERGENMLVYDFMPNRSLDAYLFGLCKEKFLDWSKRSIIMERTGRGLLYLRRDSRLRIIHRDLKASNVLLDEYLKPKISYFGMANIFGGNQYQAKTIRVVGTYGYMAPEYAMHGRFSEKTDGYSFGILILEIVSGRKTSSFNNNEDELTLLSYAWKLWNENNILKLIDPKIFDSSLQKEVVKCTYWIFMCSEYAEDRPNVSTVLSMLTRDIAELPTPSIV
ncbi:unnamed protein product [Withania somnifera]